MRRGKKGGGTAPAGGDESGQSADVAGTNPVKSDDGAVPADASALVFGDETELAESGGGVYDGAEIGPAETGGTDIDNTETINTETDSDALLSSDPSSTGEIGAAGAADPSRDAVERAGARRRHRWVLLTLVVLLVGAAGMALLSALHAARESAQVVAPTPSIPGSCPSEVIDYPENLQAARIGVYNGTGSSGIAGDAADAFKANGFTVVSVGNWDLKNNNIVAAVISGPKGRSAALAVQSFLQHSDYFSDGREDASVSVVLGDRYRKVLSAKAVTKQAAVLQCPRFADKTYEPSYNYEP